MNFIATDELRPFVRSVGITSPNFSHSKPSKGYGHRLIFVLSGSGNIEIGGKILNTSTGYAYFIAPGTQYAFRSIKELQLAVITFDLTYKNQNINSPINFVAADKFVESNIVDDSTCLFLYPDGDFREMRIDSLGIEAFYQLYNIYLSSNLSNEIKNIQLTSSFLYIIACRLNSAWIQKVDESKVLPIYSYIIANCEKPITIANVAEHFHYSTSYIAKLLRSNYQTSFKQIIINSRLSKAVWLLQNTALPLDEIANETGFYNGQHLSRSITLKYNKKPSQFR